MRKLIIGLAILLVLLVGALGFAVANINSYLEKNRDTLAGLASDAAGRRVTFESAEVAFSDGLAVRVGGLHVAEDPRFGKPDFLELEQAFVGVRLWPALQKRIEVTGIRLDAPKIRVIQTSKGFNFSSLGGEAEPTTVPAPDAEQGGAFVVAIAALEIVNGTITYQDRTSAEGLSLVIEDFSSSGTDLALDGPIAVDFSGRVHSTKAEDTGLETRIVGKAAIDGFETQVGKVHLTSPKLFPAILGVRLEDAKAGAPPESFDELVVDVVLPGADAKTGYPIKLRAKEARLSGYDLTEVVVDLVYRDSKRGTELKLDRVASGLIGGSIEVAGNLVLGEPGRSPFDLSSKIHSLDSGALATHLLGVPNGLLSGRLGGDAHLTGDSLEWDSLKRSLAGSLNLELGEGALEKVNVLDTLVGRLISDPGLGMLAANSIREAAGDVLNGNRTPFKNVGMQLEVSGGAIRAKDLVIAAGDFAINAAGTVGLDGKIAADGTIKFSEDLSKKILAKANRFGSALGDGKTVTIPIQFGGTASSPRIMPDLRALTATAATGAKEELKNRAAKEIGDALFGKKKKDAEGNATEDPVKERDRNSTEGLVKEGLGRLLGR